MTIIAFQGAIILGMIYAIMAVGVFISFRTLDIPDLTVDSSFVTELLFRRFFALRDVPGWRCRLDSWRPLWRVW